MSNDLIAALRAAGHDDQAEAIERKELVGRLRESGRADLADRLEAPETPAPETPTKSPEMQLAEGLRDHLNASTSQWFSLGGGA